MKKKHATRWIALLLAVLTVLTTFSFSVFATSEGGETEDSGFSRTNEEIRTLLDTISYREYSEKYAGTQKATESFVVHAATDYIMTYPNPLDPEQIVQGTTAQVEVLNSVGGVNSDTLKVGDTGKVTFKITVPVTGMYSVSMRYYPIGDRATSIERMFYIDGKIPFAEARYLTMTKVWQDVYSEQFGKFDVDEQGSDVRPNKIQTPEWRNYEFCDSTGYFVNPFSFYLEAGEHVITFESVRESIVIDTITFAPAEQNISYAQYLAQYAGAKDVSGKTIHLSAEHSSAASEQILYPIYDRTSAITEPQHASQIRLNTIGAEKWQTVGQWIRYDNITVEETGFYQIAVRFKQDKMSGMFASRRIRINGEVPFEEASYLQFPYDGGWQSTALTDGTTDFKFYFEAGKTYSLEFEVVLGGMADILREVSEILSELNDDYLQILMITGASPDEYRDYGFFSLMPDVIGNLRDQAKRLHAISAKFYEVTGSKGSSTATIDKVANLIDRMASKETEVAKNLESFKTYLGTLGTWLYSAQQQALEMDFIEIQGVGDELPKADAGFFAATWFEFRQFFASFVADYNSVGGSGAVDEANSTNIVIWYTGGRDRAQILRQLIDNEFVPTTKELYGHTINVELKLVAGGLLQSVLAGIGPDVSFLASTDTINWALRGALLPLNARDGFYEITTGENAWFAQDALVPLRLNLGDGKEPLAYGLPNTMSFAMMFYRMDIFVELGLSVPKTWDEFYALLPILQTNNMEVAFPSQLGGLNMLNYQMGGTLYAENDTDGAHINFEHDTTLTAWEELLGLFEQYRVPLAFDFPTRFRTGEIPIGIVDYLSYNQLMLYASELRGLWEFVPLPGYKDANGNINNSAILTVDAVVMPRGVEEELQEDAWRLMKWYCSAPTQARYSNELQAVLGTGAKYNTANIQAIEELPWTASEYRALQSQMQHLKGIPEFPGSYIITRYVQFAFMNVYNSSGSATGNSAVESLLDYVIIINKELNRKRKEFDLAYDDLY